MNTISHSKYYLQLNVFAILLKARTGQGLRSAWALIPVATKVTSSAMLTSARSARWSRRCLMTNGSRTAPLCSSVVANAKVKCHFHQSLNGMYVLFIACTGYIDDEDRQTSILQSAGPICAGCEAPLSDISLRLQLENQIRQHISKYYEGWTVCDDPVCRNRTRMMGVYGRRCLKPGCKGTVAFEVR